MKLLNSFAQGKNNDAMETSKNSKKTRNEQKHAKKKINWNNKKNFFVYLHYKLKREKFERRNMNFVKRKTCERKRSKKNFFLRKIFI